MHLVLPVGAPLAGASVYGVDEQRECTLVIAGSLRGVTVPHRHCAIGMCLFDLEAGTMTKVTADL
jgi:hypothetical protein